MVKTTELEKITKDEGIIIGYEEFPPPLKGIYIRNKEMPIIGLDTRLDPIEKRCILAEEIGHHFTLPDGMDLRESHRYGIVGKRIDYETKARMYAALLLMPQDQWLKAINKKNITMKELMTTFMVTKEMLYFRFVIDINSRLIKRKKQRERKAFKRHQAKQKKLQRKRQAQIA